MTKYEYEFETVNCDSASGYSLFGGVGPSTEGHREIIAQRASEGWRFVGVIPASQRAGGFIETVDLVFERPAAEE